MMRRLFVCLFLVLGVTLFALAQNTPATTTPATQPAASNTKCPVSGDAVDAKAKTVVYQGKTIGFCCDNCIEPFNKNPEKYGKNIK